MANAAEHSGANGHAGVIGGTGGRLGAARLMLWALAGLLAVRQAAVVMRVPPGEWLSGFHLPGSLPGSLYENGQFTGTPSRGWSSSRSSGSPRPPWRWPGPA